MSHKPKQLKHSDLPKLRKKLLKKQKGKCAICGKSPKRPCVDHEHKKRLKGSGLIRGVLCSSCNVFLAKMENNCVRYGIKLKHLPKILKRTRRYIKKAHLPLIHPSEKTKNPKLKKASWNKFKKVYERVIGRTLPKSLQYPKSKKLTKVLATAYEKLNLKPEFYKD